MYVANIVAEDEPDEMTLVSIGPYETCEAAQADGEAYCAFLDDELPDHEWIVDVCEVVTYNEAILQFRS